MKSNKNNLDKVLARLEQYYSGINDPRPVRGAGAGAELDVPNAPDDKGFITSLPLEAVPGSTLQKGKKAAMSALNAATYVIDNKEIPKDPVIKTKKGKNVLRQPVDPEDTEIKDVEMFDKKGKEIEDWDDDIKDLDRSEPEETVNDLDENIIFEKDDENGLGKIAQDNMGEQNPATGENPNIDPTQQAPDPNAMMGGAPAQAGMGQDPNAMMAGNPGMIGQDPNAMMAGNPGMIGQDPNAMAMGMGGAYAPAPELTAQNVGKVFELKKIYSRLLSIESQLSFSSDHILLKLRKLISDAIELFETVISNIGSYREEIDGIIIMYYEFLTQVYDIMKRYYKIKEREDKKEMKNK